MSGPLAVDHLCSSFARPCSRSIQQLCRHVRPVCQATASKESPYKAPSSSTAATELESLRRFSNVVPDTVLMSELSQPGLPSASDLEAATVSSYVLTGAAQQSYLVNLQILTPSPDQLSFARFDVSHSFFQVVLISPPETPASVPLNFLVHINILTPSCVCSTVVGFLYWLMPCSMMPLLCSTTSSKQHIGSCRSSSISGTQALWDSATSAFCSQHSSTEKIIRPGAGQDCLTI